VGKCFGLGETTLEVFGMVENLVWEISEMLMEWKEGEEDERKGMVEESDSDCH
jgi:hypothetical protein